MLYKTLLFFALPIFVFSAFYVQPELIMGKRILLPAAGVGYRLHKMEHGFDISLNALPFGACGRIGPFPFLKTSYLHYPNAKVFYWGLGANVGVITGPLASIGCESKKTEKVFIFAQVDASYPLFPKDTSLLGMMSFGIGF